MCVCGGGGCACMHASVIVYRVAVTFLDMLISSTHFVCSSEPIIVYGSNIHAYCCVQSLLTLGIAGSNIALVQPPTEVSLLDQLTTGIDVSPGERQLHPFEWCTSDKYINRPPHCQTELR